jgi:hypothetical protein
MGDSAICRGSDAHRSVHPNGCDEVESRYKARAKDILEGRRLGLHKLTTFNLWL